MKKKGLLILSCLVTVGIVAGSAFAIGSQNSESQYVDADDTLTMTFGPEDIMEGNVQDYEDTPIYSNKDVTLKTDQYKNDVVFHYDDSRAYSFSGHNYFDMVTSDSAFYNKSEIRSIVSFKAYGIGDFRIEWGWEKVADEIQYIRHDDIYFGFTTEVFDFEGEYPNYFRIYPTDNDKRQLSDFVISFKAECVSGENPYPSYSNVDGVVFEDNGSNMTCRGFNGRATSVYAIPSHVNSKPVVEISSEAFARYSKLQSITIPNTVTSIIARAFYSTYNCTSVTFESGGTELLSIGMAAFDTNGHTGVFTLPSRISSMDMTNGYIFRCTNHITKFELNDDNVEGNKVSVDAAGALFYQSYSGKYLVSFPKNSPVTEYTIPADVSYVDCYDGFGDVDNLEKLVINNSQQITFLENACVDMTSLNCVEIHDTGYPVVFNWFVFSSCFALSEIVFPENVIVKEKGLGTIPYSTDNPIAIHLVASSIPDTWDDDWDNGMVAAGYATVDFDYVP